MPALSAAAQAGVDGIHEPRGPVQHRVPRQARRSRRSRGRRSTAQCFPGASTPCSRARNRYSVTVIDYRDAESDPREDPQGAVVRRSALLADGHSGLGPVRRHQAVSHQAGRQGHLRRLALHRSRRGPPAAADQRGQHQDLSSSIYLHENRLYIVDATVPANAPAQGIFQQNLGFRTRRAAGCATTRSTRTVSRRSRFAATSRVPRAATRTEAGAAVAAAMAPAEVAAASNDHDFYVHFEQLDIEDERRVRRNDAVRRTGGSVGQVRRNDDAPQASHLHSGHALIEAANHAARADREARTAATGRHRRIELLALVLGASGRTSSRCSSR